MQDAGAFSAEPAETAPPATNLLPVLSAGDAAWQPHGGATAEVTSEAAPIDGATVLRHRLQGASPQPHGVVFGCRVALPHARGGLVTLSAHVRVPGDFRGTAVALACVGNAAVTSRNIELRRRDAWQRLQTVAEMPAGQTELFCALTVSAEAGDCVLSSAWQLEQASELGDYVPPGGGQAIPVPEGVIRARGKSDSLGYLYSPHGLNNQKLALLGLFLAARQGPIRRIVLPDMLVFDQASTIRRTAALGDVYQLKRLHFLADAEGIEIVPQPPAGDAVSVRFFQDGAQYIARRQGADGLMPSDFACRFLRNLRALHRDSTVMRKLRTEVFDRRGIRIVAQLRIENDWTVHARHALSRRVTAPEDYAPSFQQIIGKIKHSLSDWRAGIYIVCDEAALPTDKETIRAVTREELGVDLVWKSDILHADEMATLNLLDLSVLDLETAIAAPSFVGLTRSTFSNLAALESFARNKRDVTSHYIYNLAGPALGRRTDNGAFAFPQAACRPRPAVSRTLQEDAR